MLLIKDLGVETRQCKRLCYAAFKKYIFYHFKFHYKGSKDTVVGMDQPSKVYQSCLHKSLFAICELQNWYALLEVVFSRIYVKM